MTCSTRCGVWHSCASEMCPLPAAALHAGAGASCSSQLPQASTSWSSSNCTGPRCALPPTPLWRCGTNGARHTLVARSSRGSAAWPSSFSSSRREAGASSSQDARCSKQAVYHVEGGHAAAGGHQGDGGSERGLTPGDSPGRPCGPPKRCAHAPAIGRARGKKCQRRKAVWRETACAVVRPPGRSPPRASCLDFNAGDSGAEPRHAIYREGG